MIPSDSEGCLMTQLSPVTHMANITYLHVIGGSYHLYNHCNTMQVSHDSFKSVTPPTAALIFSAN